MIDRTIVNEDFTRKVKKYVDDGLSDSQIASLLCITPTAFRTLVKTNKNLGDIVRYNRVQNIKRISDVLYTRALDGDVKAIMFFLKNRDPDNWHDQPDRFTKFEFDTKGTPSEQASQILKAVSEGILAVDSAMYIMNALATLLKIDEQTSIRKELDELKALMYGESVVTGNQGSDTPNKKLPAKGRRVKSLN